MSTPVKWGVETLANTTITNNQGMPAITGLDGGGFVAVWYDNSQAAGDTNGDSVRAQIFDAFGAKIGAEFVVNSTTANDQKQPDIVALAGGGFVAVWADTSTVGDASFGSVKGQVFSAAGTKVGGQFLVNTQTNNPQEFPAVTALDSGGFATVWTDSSGVGDSDGLGSSVAMQRFDGSGGKVGAQTLVPTTKNLTQRNADIASIGDNKFVVVWEDTSATGGDASGTTIRMQVYNDDGTPHGTEKLVPTETSSDQTFPAVTGLGNGNFVVSWTDASSVLDSSSTGIVAQMFNSDGGKIGDDFRVNTTQQSFQWDSALAPDGKGGFLAVWTDISNGLWDVRAQLFSADGTTTPTPDGSEIVVNTTTGGDQDEPIVTRLADGRFVAGWRDGSQLSPDNSGWAVLFQILDSRSGAVTGTDKGEVLAGSFMGSAIVNDTIKGLGGNDKLYGFDGNDTLDGGAGTDELDGGIGDDTYVLGADTTDAISDAGGIDTITSSISRSLASFAAIEKLTLIGAANINATGNGAANVLKGGSGNNTLDGGTGADTMAGYQGDDTYVVDNAGDVVAENAGNGKDTVKSSINYTLGASFEELTLTGAANIKATGNGAANVLRGNSGNNTLDGGAGADTMAGYQGDDTYIVDSAGDVVAENAGNGKDTAKSSIDFTLGANFEELTLTGAGNIKGTGNGDANVLRGNTGNNILSGAGGADTIAGYGGNDTLSGSAGNDILAGGGGQDTFLFNAALNAASNKDTISDFLAADDVIHLENAIFGKLSATGPLDAGFFRAGVAALDANDHVIYNQATGQISYDADGSGAGAATAFATLATKPAITAADFVVI